jgi:hypothetical protein
MILDSLFQFSLAAGDVPTVTAVSGNIVDIGIGSLANPAIPSDAAGGGARDLGIGDQPSLKLLVEVTAAFAGGTSLQVQVQGAPDNGAGAPGAFTTMASGPVVALAQLIQGAQICDLDIPRPAPGQVLPRYLQLNYVIVGTMSGGGTLKAWAVLDRFDQIGSQTGLLSGYVPGITIPN